MPAPKPFTAPSPASVSVDKEWLPSSSSSDGCRDTSTADDSTASDVPSPEQPLKVPPDELPRLHVVTVATHADGYFTSLVYSSVLLQTGLRVLGWGEKWKGFGMKEVKLVEYCRRVPPRDVVMLVDGFDTVILQPSEVIVRKFLEFGGRVVLTGESRSKSFLSSVFLMFHNCVFKSALSNSWPKPLPYANKNMNVRLLNAGGMIGYAEDLINLFKDFEHSWNDQRYLSAVFMKEPHKVVTIDANCSIFSLYRSRKHFKVLTYKEAEEEARHVVPYFPDDAEYNEEAAQKRCPAPSFQRSALRGVVMDAVTRETPCVLHMYCRRNADSLIEALGLPKGEKVMNPARLVWYAFFSLHGTLLHASEGKTRWHTPYVIAFLSAVITGVGIVGLLLNALINLGSLSVARRVASHVQVRAGAALSPLLLPQMWAEGACGGGERDLQPTVHQSSWFTALQLLLHLVLLSASSVSRPGSVLLSTIAHLLPVFAAFAVAGSLVLGVLLHVHGGFGDEDEIAAAADPAVVGTPAGIQRKRWKYLNLTRVTKGSSRVGAL